MLNEQINCLFDKLDLPNYTFYNYIPFCASCPICGGNNTLLIRKDRQANSTYLYLSCEVCRTAGDVEDWLLILNDSDSMLLENKYRDMTEAYIDSLRSFEDSYYRIERTMRTLGYNSPKPPPGNAFSIMSEEQVQSLRPIGRELNLKYCTDYVAIPLYKHVGMIEDIILYDGKRFTRLFKDKKMHTNNYGFCGNLPWADVDQLFVAPSILDLIKILGKQRLENVEDDRFYVVTDMSENNGKEENSTFRCGRIRSDNIIFLRRTSDRTSQLWELPGKDLCSEIWVIDNYEEHSIASLSTNVSSIARIANPYDVLHIKKAIKISKQPYRFFIKNNRVVSQKLMLGYPKTGENITPVVSGLIHISKDGDNTYKIITRYSKHHKRKEYNKVPIDIVADYVAINTLLSSDYKDRQNKSVVLLDWFRKRTILPYLLLISTKTAEVLNKGEYHAIKNK